jgi:hypothetical protein
MGRWGADPTDGLFLCVDGRAVIRACRDVGARVIFHGHKHVDLAGIAAGVWVRGARSTTLGCERTKMRPGYDRVWFDSTGLLKIDRYELGPAAGGEGIGGWHKWYEAKKLA